MAGRTKTTEQFLAEVNQLYDNEFELCGVEYTGAKKEMSLRHKECGNIVTKRADSFFRAKCEVCRKTNPKNIAIALEKRIKTNNRIFGVDFVMQSEEGKKRFIATIEGKGGNEAFKERIKKTNLERYGVEWAPQREDFKEEQSLITKDELIKLISSFKERPSIEDLMPLTPYAFSSGLRAKIHNSGLWDMIKHDFSVSSGEQELFNWIKSKLPELEIIQSDRSVLKRLEIDIYIPALKIGIEYCGIYWHSSSSFAAKGNPKPKNYHRDKMKAANKEGIRLIQIFETEWLNSRDLVQAKLLSILGLNTINKVYARKCNIKEVNNEQLKDFLQNNHIQGYISASKRYGLFSDNELIAIMSFRKSKEGYELSRYCTKLGYQIIGGAGKLLKHFRVNNDFPTIITFADLRWTNKEKNMYLSIGFNLEYETEPNYFYYLSQEKKLVSRQSFQKQRIKNKFPEVYNDDKTETQMMEELKILVIYDCGNLKYIMR